MIKITGGIHKGKKLLLPKGVRATPGKIREAIFCMVECEGKCFLDAFAGSGSVGIEALSRGAEDVYFIEKSSKVAKKIEENLKRVGEKGRIIVGDALKIVRKLPSIFDVIFIDPPYEKGYVKKILPFLFPILKKDGVIIIEHSKRECFKKDGYGIKEKRYDDTVITIIWRLK